MTSIPHPDDAPAADHDTGHNLLFATAAPAMVEEGRLTLVSALPDDELTVPDGLHAPNALARLEPTHPDTSLTETRRLRHDGWTPDKKRLFLEAFAMTGVVKEACLAVGLSARAAYDLRGRDPLFAAGWEAAALISRRRLADELLSRAMNGVVERVYSHGAVVAERHRFDNKLSMAVLNRLDARVDRAEERGEAGHRLAGCWSDFLSTIEEDRTADGEALLAAADASACEVREDHLAAAPDPGADMDLHEVWEEDGRDWTDYPPPAGFAGVEEGRYGENGYRRTLSPAEQAALDADDAATLAAAEAQRDACFGLAAPVKMEAATGAPPPCGPAQARPVDGTDAPVSVSPRGDPARAGPQQPPPPRDSAEAGPVDSTDAQAGVSASSGPACAHPRGEGADPPLPPPHPNCHHPAAPLCRSPGERVAEAEAA